jgi:Methylase involved in ubiquinone/menaquinone biosynthesis
MSPWIVDFFAPVYDRVNHPWIVDPAKVVAMLGLEGSERVLDVAGGTGAVAQALVQGTRAHVTVLDSSTKMLAQVPTHKRIQTVHGLATSLPFQAETFDVVLCTSALHQLEPQNIALAAMRRVLKPGGRLLIVDFDPDGLAGPVLSWGENLFKQGHQYLAQADLAGMLREAGFVGRFAPFSLIQYAFLGVKET